MFLSAPAFLWQFKLTLPWWMSSHIVPKTQSLRNLQIRWFFSDLFSSLAQTFAMNWSRGSRVQTELCGLELSVMGKSLLFSSLLLHFSILSLFPQLSAESFCARVCTVVLVTHFIRLQHISWSRWKMFRKLMRMVLQCVNNIFKMLKPAPNSAKTIVKAQF